MQKTISVNLCGSYFTIDEDAFNLLNDYINNVKSYFSKLPDGQEITQDIESRIAELFVDKINNGTKVINLAIVQEVINRIGDPEEMQNGDEKQAQVPQFNENRESGTRHLYRDTDNKVLGGVISGLAAYIGCDVMVARIIALLLLCFFSGVTIIVYIVLWAVIPAANTAAQKLDMQGLDVTLENIGKTVTDGAKKVNDYINSPEATSTLHKIGNGIIRFITPVFKGILIFLASVALVISFVLFIGFVAEVCAIGISFTEGTQIFMKAFPAGAQIETLGGLPLIWALGATTAATVLIMLPLATIGYSMLAELLNYRHLSKTVIISTLIICAIAVIFLILYIVMGYTNGSIDEFTLLKVTIQ